MRSAECGVRSAECGVRNGECGMENSALIFEKYQGATFATDFCNTYGVAFLENPQQLVVVEYFDTDSGKRQRRELYQPGSKAQEPRTLL
jgi:hypothetical protein